MIRKSFFLLMLVFMPVAVFPQSEIQKPLVLKLVEKPAKLRSGQSCRFVFDVINISSKPLTLSSICNASANLTWENRDGTGGGIGTGCSSRTIAIWHNFDPKTGNITSGTEIVPYTKDSFFTLEPNGAKRFQADLEVPTDIKARWVIVHLNFDSPYDGSLVGIAAWKGSISYDLKMLVRN
jgi:hypothetical protein